MWLDFIVASDVCGEVLLGGKILVAEGTLVDAVGIRGDYRGGGDDRRGDGTGRDYGLQADWISAFIT